jgi:membrane protease YdiL (CAAX protease family)
LKRKYTLLSSGVLVLAFVVWMVAVSVPAAVGLLFGKQIGIYGNYALLAATELLLLVPLVAYMVILKTPFKAFMGNKTTAWQNLSALLLGVLLAPAVMGLTQAWASLFTELMHAKLPDTSMYEPKTMGALLAAAVAVGVSAGVAEEPIFRGVVLRGLGSVTGKWPSILLSGLVFSLIHLDIVGAPTRFVIGVALGMLAWRSGAVLPGIFAHAGYNSATMGISLLLSVAFPGWAGFPFLQALPQAVNDILTWTILSIPFILGAWGAYVLFCRVTPKTAQWRDQPYARSEVKGFHWLPWVGAGLVVLPMIAIAFAAMFLPQMNVIPGFGGQ